MPFRWPEASAVVAALMAISGIALGEQGSVVWCPDAPEIELSECRGLPLAQGAGTVAVRIVDGCVGTPWRGPEAPPSPCAITRLFDEQSRLPVAKPCSLRIAGLHRTVRANVAPDHGSVSIPQWAETVIVSCPGLADVELTRGAVPARVSLPPGRALSIEVRSETGKPTSTRSLIELQHRRGQYATKRELVVGEVFAPGRIPLGDYSLRITSRGSATIAETFALVEGESALGLSYAGAGLLCPGPCNRRRVDADEQGWLRDRHPQ